MVVVLAIVAGAGGFSDRSGVNLAGQAAAVTPASAPAGTPASAVPSPPSASSGADGASGSARTDGPAGSAEVALPPDSGTGRRAVFSQSGQRVWIVAADDTVDRTYLVSGSVEDNLLPGTYAVYSRSRWAEGIDNSGTMQYFVRFAHGTDTGAAIGFHSIPTKHGRPLQTIAQLGTPRSHGCIRQRLVDAIAMWHFARVGTKVVVLA